MTGKSVQQTMTVWNKTAQSEGLAVDLQNMARRRLLILCGAAAFFPVLGCRPSAGDKGPPPDDDGSTFANACALVPEETAGPYPGDGSNGPNALNQMGIVRSDLRSSFGTMTGMATGIPLALNLKVVDAKNNCAPLAKRAVYLWHATRDGKYSLYTDPSQNYLRGVQETDDNGVVRFQTIFPGCYEGRYPHLHLEVFPSLAVAMNGTAKVKVSQVALPADACALVYAKPGYETSVANFARSSLAQDMVFADGSTLQVVTMAGNATSGFEGWLNVGIAG